MSVTIAELSGWLVLQAAAAQDAIPVRQVAGEPTLLEQVTSIATTVLTLSFLVLTVALVVAQRSSWRSR